jgi:hypothetical protein
MLHVVRRARRGVQPLQRRPSVRQRVRRRVRCSGVRSIAGVCSCGGMLWRARIGPLPSGRRCAEDGVRTWCIATSPSADVRHSGESVSPSRNAVVTVTCNVHHASYTMQRINATYNAQRTTRNVQHATHTLQRATRNVQHATHNTVRAGEEQTTGGQEQPLLQPGQRSPPMEPCCSDGSGRRRACAWGRRWRAHRRAPESTEEHLVLSRQCGTVGCGGGYRLGRRSFRPREMRPARERYAPATLLVEVAGVLLAYWRVLHCPQPSQPRNTLHACALQRGAA